MNEQEIAQVKVVLHNLADALVYPNNAEDVNKLGQIIAALAALTADLSVVKKTAARAIIPRPGVNPYSAFLKAN